MKKGKILYLVVLLFVGLVFAEAKTPYQRGYADGCQTARKGVVIRNTWAFNNRPNYRKGWWAGKKACRPKPAVWTYRRGYNDGCSSARGVWRKNSTAYRNIGVYRNGWNAGWRACRAKKPQAIGVGWNSYARGYSDGCLSAKGSWHKNIRAYNLFVAYRRGWTNGWRACRKPINTWNSYSRGYSDGCSSARGIWRKNLTAYRRFAAYRNGWNAGHRACAKKYNPWNSYRIGYRDGCSSRRGIWMKNVHAYRIFAAYRNGWNAGWRACRRTTPKTPVWNSFARGYNDGCSSARGVWRKNIGAYRKFRAYRDGWIQGRRDCTVRKRVPVVTAVPVLDRAAKSDVEANEISRLLYAAKEYLSQNYVKKPLPKALVLQLHNLSMDGKYAVVDVTPLFADGTEVSAEYIPEIPFQFCMEKNDKGEWHVIYDLSHSGEILPEDLEQIRSEFPKEFPTALLPEYWREVMAGEEANSTTPNPDVQPPAPMMGTDAGQK